MNQDSTRVRNSITLNTLSFEVVSYKIDHVKNISSYFTISNDTGMYTNGIKPYILTVKGYFPKINSNVIVYTLEELLQSNNDISFSIDNLNFTNAKLNKYSFSGQISNIYQESTLTFMGTDITMEDSNNE